MLLYEWQELEIIGDRISGLRDRYGWATRSKNVGLVEALKADIAQAKRQREQLLHHITAQLSWSTAPPATVGFEGD